MKLKHYIIFLFFFLLSARSFATHIVGGEIFYDCLGGNSYRITLKLYRDCSPFTAAYDNPATIFIFDSVGNFVDSVCIAFPGAVVLPYPLNNPCLNPPTNICYEEAIYQTTITLPPLAGGYNLVYQRCCRNGTILNLVNPGDVGSTYMAHIPDPALAVCNSSPHFNNFPPIFLCSGVPLNFDHSATDPDGDSLHYSLCDPYTGLTANCPILGPQTATGCNEVADPPSYPLVPWITPYNGSYPMSSSPALAVNPVTGLMTGTPNMIGQWVIGVCVEEYRNGQLISINKRDFQFNVVNCGIPVASFPTQQPFCFGLPSQFSQNSINAFTYHWDFGETGLTNDTSNLFSPTWTYSALGNYTVTLIVNPGTLCTDTNTLNLTVYPLPAMSPTVGDTICSGDTLTISLSASTASTFGWTATNNTSTTGESTTQQSGATIDDIVVNTSSSVQTVSYSVVPTSNPGGCVGSAQTVTAVINPAPTITNPPSVTICNGVAAGVTLSSTLSSTYTWVAANNANTTGESTTIQSGGAITDVLNNSASSTQTVNYTVVPTSTANGCVGASQNIAVNVLPVPTLTIPPTASICSGDMLSVPLTASTASTYTWVATNNTNTTGESTTTQSGTPLSNTITNNTTTTDQNVTYTITPTSTPDGCLGTPFTLTVTVHHGIEADFDFVKTPCVTQLTFSDSSATGPVLWHWDFGDGDTSNLQNPFHAYDTTGTYDVQLIATTANGCADTVVVQVDFVGPNPVTVSSSTDVCLGNSAQLNATGGFAYSWLPVTSLSNPNIANPVASPVDTTNYTVTVSSVDAFGDTCQQTLTTTVNAVDATMYSISASVDDDTVVQGESTTLHATTNTTSTVTWTPANGLDNPNALNPTATPDKTTTYVVSIFDSIGCPKMDSITIVVVSQLCDVESVFVPNTFTPNGDGSNDVLYVRGNQIKKLYFAVYNRRGELIYETSNIAKGWDGTYQGKLASPDVFAWYLKATCHNGSNLEKKGNVTLIR